MGFFSSKEELTVEGFCLNFYDNLTFNTFGGTIDAMGGFAEVVKNTIAKSDPRFADVDLQKLKDELTFLKCELFALAWTHKFLDGKTVIAQSVFTKHYLHEKGRDYIWEGMKPYNNMIESATLHWLTSLGKFNLPFNYNMRKDLTALNIKAANEMGINADEINEIIEMVNHRTFSEAAWKIQEFILKGLVYTIYEKLNIKEINKEAVLQIGYVIRGLYDGAQQSWDNKKIIKK